MSYQDTNTTQYELMKCFAKAHGGVTVVGDPDQSIYGWRSAEVENLNRMATGAVYSLSYLLQC
jgi:DNA helicase-2/ATP-dependent DNA helicase PcrA